MKDSRVYLDIFISSLLSYLSQNNILDMSLLISALEYARYEVETADEKEKLDG